MPFKKHGRQYDIVVFGATGYTGVLTAEHIAAHFPTDLKWAVAGRSLGKLQKVVSRCMDVNADRVQPEIEVCNVNDAELAILARKTFCLISTVGPYARHGEHAFKACAEAGTHYVDATAEVPWTLRMIKKYETTAQKSGACMFPQCAMESAPSDLLTWVMAAEARAQFSSHMGDVVLDMHLLESKVTGGTAATILNLFEQFPTREILDSMKPYALSPVSNDHQAPKLSLLSSLTGVTKVPGLGLLCTSAPAGANMAMVHRTWGLMKQETGLREEWYGPNFTYREYMYAGNRLKGMLIHYSLLTGGLLLLLPPFRALVKQLVFNPGEGPDQEQAKAERIEFRAVAKLDNGKSTAGKQILGKLSYTGSMYYLTAGFIAQAAGTLLQDDGPQLRGGVYTPACLGQPYINRLQEVGFKFETEVQTL